MMQITFGGWFQCRFAVDPDPSDDPRGVSGPTFTVPGEPPFDRIVRSNDFVMPRWPRNANDGVKVTQVQVGAQTIADHALLGARVHLRDGAQFQQRNLIIVEQAWSTPIDPFDLEIETDGIRIRRKALWDVTRPGLTVYDVFLEPALLNPRLNTAAIQSVEVAEATGVMDYHATRAQRLQQLEALLQHSTDPVERAALEKRLRGLRNDRLLVGQMLAATQFMGMQANYAFPLNGVPLVHDPQDVLGGVIGRSQPWPLSFWFGGYDVDTLFGYMQGTLSLPFLARRT